MKKTYKEIMEEREARAGTVPYKTKENTYPFKSNILPDVTVKPAVNVSSPNISAPSVSEPRMPAALKGKDLNPNYTQRMWESALEGDYPGAMYNEMMHNEKNGYLGLGYANSHIFNYDDPYRGDLDRQREAIYNRDPFSYDYREDDLYKTILSKKEKEAEQAYKDGYAQLSRQFDGDIPVNMLNKLQATKSEIIDQADSYIPQLYQLAREKYAEEGNKMLTDYGLTKQIADEDYARWLGDRDFVVGGSENKYARDLAREQFDYNKGIDERNFDYQKGIDERNFDANVKDNAIGLASALYSTGLYGSFEEAYQEAKKYY